jgi:hypothetical protein
MQWQYKGIHFTITTAAMGPLYMASARVPQEEMFVRVRPFSAIGTSEEQALQLLKDQIKLEFLQVPGSDVDHPGPPDTAC